MEIKNGQRWTRAVIEKEIVVSKYLMEVTNAKINQAKFIQCLFGDPKRYNIGDTWCCNFYTDEFIEYLYLEGQDAING
jgi:hypothetical protein